MIFWWKICNPLESSNLLWPCIVSEILFYTKSMAQVVLALLAALRLFWQLQQYPSCGKPKNTTYSNRGSSLGVHISSSVSHQWMLIFWSSNGVIVAMLKEGGASIGAYTGRYRWPLQTQQRFSGTTISAPVFGKEISHLWNDWEDREVEFLMAPTIPISTFNISDLSLR